MPRYRDSSSWFYLRRFVGFGARVESGDRARLCNRVLAPVAGRVLTGDRRSEVFELARVRVEGLDHAALHRAVRAAQLDHGAARVPRIVEPEGAARARHLELVARRQVEAAVDRREHIAGEAEQPGEAHVDAIAAAHLLLS